MTVREAINAEINSLSDLDLQQLYPVIKTFVESRQSKEGGGLLAKLRSVQIDAPADFARHLDEYTSEERNAETDLR